MRCFRNVVMLSLSALLLAICAGCVTAPQVPQVGEDLLVAAGFKTVAARTAVQQQHLRSLQQGALSEMQQTGRHYYVYPDVASNQLYVGTPNEYQKYLALRTQKGLPNPAPPNATSADLQQYVQRDAAMTKADSQIRENFSWAAWPDFAIIFRIP